MKTYKLQLTRSLKRGDVSINGKSYGPFAKGTNEGVPQEAADLLEAAGYVFNKAEEPAKPEPKPAEKPTPKPETP